MPRTVLTTIPILTVSLVASLGNAVRLPAQQATELPGKPFVIQSTWTIGGEGNWDYLTLDPAALLLYVAHGPAVQVIDLSTGTLAGKVSGLRDAHGIALDDSGAFGYISDGPANEVKVFDRRSFQVTATLRTGPNPRAIVFDPASKLVFAICTQTAIAPTTSRAAARTNRRGTQSYDPELKSVVTVIDTQSTRRIADLLFPGKLGFAQSDGNGHIFVNVTDRNQIVEFDSASATSAIAAAPVRTAPATVPGTSPAARPADRASSSVTAPPVAYATIDLSRQLRSMPLGQSCFNPRGLAIDSSHQRLFVACNNQRMQVLNADNGQVITTLPTGPGAEAIGYDPNRGLIYTANGGGEGSLTVIQQHVTDTYAVVQQVPTRQRARTLAVNPDTGQVYLVTNLEGFDLSKPGTGGGEHTLPVVQSQPVQGSFQVLVIGN